MREEAVFADRRERVTEQLGEAMLAAIGLMVRQYMGAPTEENEGQDSADAAWDGSGGTIERGAVNESFDAARYRQLGGEMSAPVQEENGDRAETQEEGKPARAEKAARGQRETAERAADLAVHGRQMTAERAAEPQSGEKRRQWEIERRTEEGEPPLSARALSGEIERDARRYDSGFYLY